MQPTHQIHKSNPELRRLVSHDIPRCAKLAALAFQSDRHTQFKASRYVDPYDHELAMVAALKHWISRPPEGMEITCAVDTDSSEILGWVAWGFHARTPLAMGAQQQDSSSVSESTAKTSRLATIAQCIEGQSLASDRQRLEEHTSADLSSWMAKLMPPESRCMYIASIVVHPKHQGRGIGSLLIRQGLRRADAESLYCWVHASEPGSLVFDEHGFREVGVLDVDLDSWNSEGINPPKSPSREWGHYIFRYMRREPVKESLLCAQSECRPAEGN